MAERPSAGIVLAGGQGSRLGLGPPKAVRIFAGLTLLEHACRVLWSRAAMVLVAVPSGFPLPPGPYERVDDLPEGEGPLAGLVPALELVAAREVALAWALAVDLPWIAPVHLDLLERALVRGGPQAVAAAPVTAKGLEPLCCAYRPVAAAAEVRAAWSRGERGVRSTLERLGERLVRVEVGRSGDGSWPGGEGSLESLNTRVSWEAAERRLAAGEDAIEEP